MIFAAGLGTRLRPLTNNRPKALVEIGDTPILEIVARRLVDAGADRLIINTHPFPDIIEEHVRACDNFGVEVRFSYEPDAPLDTGGGLRQAAPLFRGDAPFFMHNCDVISDVDLRALYDAHLADDDAIATLAVLPLSAERYLIFDDDGLCGYSPRGGGDNVLIRETRGDVTRNDFTGIHIGTPALIDSLPDQQIFSIMAHYLSLARRGRRVARHAQPHARWIDIGTPEKLEAAIAIAEVQRRREQN
ncbi:MAG TPA: nucleotidyltransferase family protein [Longimicrobiales bacterium]|nr:nucleotidyltransferase family protein [Longimicrobiales bacterium]